MAVSAMYTFIFNIQLFNINIISNSLHYIWAILIFFLVIGEGYMYTQIFHSFREKECLTNHSCESVRVERDGFALTPVNLIA